MTGIVYLWDDGRIAVTDHYGGPIGGYPTGMMFANMRDTILAHADQATKFSVVANAVTTSGQRVWMFVSREEWTRRGDETVGSLCDVPILVDCAPADRPARMFP